MSDDPLPRPARTSPKSVARTRKTPPMSVAAVRGFIEALSRAYPEAASELDFADPYTLLCAVVMSAQTTDVSVNKVGRILFAAAPTPVAMVALGVDAVGVHIRSIGLWKAKAKNVVELSRLLIERHGGVVPDDRDALEALPGVGRKTASVVLNVAFGHDAMAVDTHIFRLGNRTGIAPGKTVRQVEDGLVKRIPKEMLRPAHHWLILHGRYVCKARRPECWRCVAREWCRLPAKEPGPASTSR